VKAIAKLLILLALPACGAPGSEQVFTKLGEKAPAPVQARGRGPSAPPIPFKRFEGFYNRLGEISQFQPCGAEDALDVNGTAEARAVLRERFRWNSPWQGLKMFAVFTGSIVTDTPRVKGRAAADTAPPVTRTFFFITAVESLRTVQDADCRRKR
jgi:hypothetical protein